MTIIACLCSLLHPLSPIARHGGPLTEDEVVYRNMNWVIQQRENWISFKPLSRKPESYGSLCALQHSWAEKFKHSQHGHEQLLRKILIPLKSTSRGFNQFHQLLSYTQSIAF